jgi:hypothetical protein
MEVGPVACENVIGEIRCGIAPEEGYDIFKRSAETGALKVVLTN